MIRKKWSVTSRDRQFIYRLHKKDNATKYVCHWDPAFADYLAKKRAEGKHYNIAISHAAKKLVRLIFAMEKSRQPYRSAA